jgi:hypothetical protein
MVTAPPGKNTILRREDEIKETIVECSAEFKAELDSRVNHYLKVSKIVSSIEMNKRLQALRKKESSYVVSIFV